MRKDLFTDKILRPRLDAIHELFADKSVEYASDKNIFENFTQGARMDNITPQKCLWDYMRKHLVSIKDMIDNPHKTTPEKASEKIGDVILYLITLEGMIIENCSSKKH